MNDAKRKKLSGAQYAKLRTDKQRRIENQLKKNQKIDLFLKSNISNNDEPHQRSESEIPGISAASVLAEEPTTSSSSTCEQVGSGKEKSVETSVETDNDVNDNDVNDGEKNINANSLITSSDPANWEARDNRTIEYLLQNGIEQHIQEEFPETKRVYPDTVRFLKKRAFFRKMANGEEVLRTYLVYSVSKKNIFCAPCKLLGGRNAFTSGFSDWRNVYKALQQHENSPEHKKHEIDLLNRRRIAGM